MKAFPIAMAILKGMFRVCIFILFICCLIVSATLTIPFWLAEVGGIKGALDHSPMEYFVSFVEHLEDRMS